MLKKITRNLCVFAVAGSMLFSAGMNTSFAHSRDSDKGLIKKIMDNKIPENDAKNNKEKFAKGELIVKYKTARSDKNKVKEKIRKAAKSKLFKPETKERLSENLEVIDVDRNEDINALVKELSSDPEVEYVQPNYIYQAFYEPQEPRFPEQWALKNTGTGVDINATKAWDITKGTSSVVVGVLDTGIAFKHPDLAANIYINPNEVQDNQDNDGNKLVDDLRGWDFYNNDNTIIHSNETTHGTHVAGIIAACENNQGVTGIAPNVKIMPLKVLNETGKYGRSSDIVKAIDYAASKGVTILNMSLGMYSKDEVLADKMNNNPQILFVVAAGNDGRNLRDLPVYPACFNVPNMLVVANLSSDGALYLSSNYGSEIDIAAPGTSILSTYQNIDSNNKATFDYSNMDGTSMAAPYVAGVAALIKSHYPNASVTDIISRIKNNAAIDEDIKARVPGGLVLDAYCALKNSSGINFTKSSVTENSVYIEWQPVAGAASYKIQTAYGIINSIGTNKINIVSLQPDTGYAFTVSAVNSEGQTIAERRFIRRTLKFGTGTGFEANYFNDVNMNALKVSRNENINFNWGSGSPDTSLNNQSFSGLWNGLLEAKYTEEYTLYVQTLGAFKLWVDGKLVASMTADNSNTITELSGKINLQAGKLYPIQVEYYESFGSAAIKLLWSSATQSKEIIPATRLYKSSPQCGAWSQSAESDIPCVINISHALVEGGKLYAISNPMYSKSRIEVFDDLQNKFIKIKDLVFHYYQASTSLNGKIYLFTNSDTANTTTEVSEYDIGTGELKINSPVTFSMVDNDGAITVNGQIYVFGGGQNHDVSIYDPINNSFTPVAQMPDLRTGYSLAQLDGKIYMTGGSLVTGTDPNTGNIIVENSKNVYVFNTQNNSWEQKADMPETLKGHGSVVKNGKIFVYGGGVDPYRYVSTGYLYDPVENTWATLDNLLSPRAYFGIENYNGKIYTIYGMADLAYNYFDVLEEKYATTYKISGYIKPDVTSSNTQIKAGFKVEVDGLGKAVLTDQNGYFQITGIPSNVDGYTLKINKGQYITREIKNVRVKASDVQVGTQTAPIDMWSGDIAKDDMINALDAMEISKCMDAVQGNTNFNPVCDLNMDGTISMQDFDVLYKHFGATTVSYPNLYQ